MMTNLARDRLIQSTQELLWQRGYTATSPAAIMKQAAVGQGSMYHHFSGKTELAAEAFRLSAEATYRKAKLLLDNGTPALDRVISYLLRQRDVLRGCPVGRMAEDAEVLTTPELFEILQSTFNRLRALISEVLSEGVSTAELPTSLAPAELADTVLAIVQGGYVLARAENDPAPFERAVNGAVALLRAAADGQARS
ncbi:TetR family transcriptional regulator [Psychromicrobium lacuslunae]|uniref:TetR family transcriptional regulator n=2 Tax=Psychromicrobium lacuslunae TaxID=1618207 RepID=A0A0D4C326_9MICC|nr:TetR family transcriptional regulator [Psychromicrobium lacuslunae]